MLEGLDKSLLSAGVQRSVGGYFDMKYSGSVFVLMTSLKLLCLFIVYLRLILHVGKFILRAVARKIYLCTVSNTLLCMILKTLQFSIYVRPHANGIFDCAISIYVRPHVN